MLWVSHTEPEQGRCKRIPVCTLPADGGAEDWPSPIGGQVMQRVRISLAGCWVSSTLSWYLSWLDASIGWCNWNTILCIRLIGLHGPGVLRRISALWKLMGHFTQLLVLPLGYSLWLCSCSQAVLNLGWCLSPDFLPAYNSPFPSLCGQSHVVASGRMDEYPWGICVPQLFLTLCGCWSREPSQEVGTRVAEKHEVLH